MFRARLARAVGVYRQLVEGEPAIVEQHRVLPVAVGRAGIHDFSVLNGDGPLGGADQQVTVEGVTAQVENEIIEGAVFDPHILGQVADQVDLHIPPLKGRQVFQAVGYGGESAACADRIAQVALCAQRGHRIGHDLVGVELVKACITGAHGQHGVAGGVENFQVEVGGGDGDVVVLDGDAAGGDGVGAGPRPRRSLSSV